MIALAGLVLIACGWLLQLAGAFKGKKEVNRGFVAVYCLGAALLAWDGFSKGMSDTAFLNLASLAVALAVLLKLVRGKR